MGDSKRLVQEFKSYSSENVTLWGHKALPTLVNEFEHYRSKWECDMFCESLEDLDDDSHHDIWLKFWNNY